MKIKVKIRELKEKQNKGTNSFFNAEKKAVW